jgi:Neuraminidase-like domain
MAASALGILKAQQPNEQAWLSLAPGIMNTIRQNQSAALQAYLTAQRNVSGQLIYGDTNVLFDYFLIDTQMTACQVTSRVVQAYIAIQIFVERCLMNLEAPAVVVDLNQDETWNQWQWMSRFRIWQANREVFLYPENWLIESQRPNRTENYQTFEQEVRQAESTADYLQTVVLNYIDRLESVSHLLVTGICEDPASGAITVIARTPADPPVFYIRSYETGAWSGWSQIPLNIKAHQVVPALYGGRVCLFWLEVKPSSEPQQSIGAPEPSSISPEQTPNQYATLGINFSVFRNGNWSSAQSATGSLFDRPPINSSQVADTRSIEALYTIRVQTPATSPGLGSSLFVDVFRLGNLFASSDMERWDITGYDPLTAIHLGRATFDGRFQDLELRNVVVFIGVPPTSFTFVSGGGESLLPHAKATYGPDAQPLVPLADADPDLVSDSGLVWRAGALSAYPTSDPLEPVTMTLAFSSVGKVLGTASLPLRVVGPDTDVGFDPTAYFFYQDNRRCYWVQSQTLYWTGSAWSPAAPSYPSSTPREVLYSFHPFYYPFARLFWHQLSAGGFDLLYDPNLQQAPDSIDTSYAEAFSFQTTYSPVPTVQWDHASVTTALAAGITNTTQTTITVRNNVWVPVPAFFVTIGAETMQVTGVSGPQNTTWTVARGQQGSTASTVASGTPVTPVFASQDRQFLDFTPSGAYSVYNWELFYHIPLYVAQLLSQNQQFEDAQTWLRYIFDPTRQGSEPAPQRFWIPKPLRDLTSADIQAQQINALLTAVNQGDASAMAQVQLWRNNPFDPFLLADQRPVAYMKSAVMSYLDNIVAWADNLFASESREALSEATLLYVIASQMLGPTPAAVTPPPRADESFDQLSPSLDAFANAMVEIENVIGGAGGSGAGSGSGGPLPVAQTFYFKIPPNPTLLNYWSTVADRLFKLRNCQNIAGAPLDLLALFDAPIDPGLLISAQAAGVDLSSVLSDVAAPLPNYRFTALYPQAMDFVNAVRAYGSALQAALEKADAGALTLLQRTNQLQLLNDASQIFDWRVQQAEFAIEAATQAVALAQQRFDFNDSQIFANDWETMQTVMNLDAIELNAVTAILDLTASAGHMTPSFTFGVAGIGGTPVAELT